MGATVTAPIHTAHPITNPARLPNAKCGYRVDPPATGYMLPSSACVSARTSITRAPSTHEIIAAGPAICAEVRAPKSHPDPMIDPSDTKSSPTELTSLCSLRPAPASPVSLLAAIVTPPLSTRRIDRIDHETTALYRSRLSKGGARVFIVSSGIPLERHHVPTPLSRCRVLQSFPWRLTTSWITPRPAATLSSTRAGPRTRFRDREPRPAARPAARLAGGRSPRDSPKRPGSTPPDTREPHPRAPARRSSRRPSGPRGP